MFFLVSLVFGMLNILIFFGTHISGMDLGNFHIFLGTKNGSVKYWDRIYHWNGVPYLQTNPFYRQLNFYAGWWHSHVCQYEVQYQSESWWPRIEIACKKKQLNSLLTGFIQLMQYTADNKDCHTCVCHIDLDDRLVGGLPYASDMVESFWWRNISTFNVSLDIFFVPGKKLCNGYSLLQPTLSAKIAMINLKRIFIILQIMMMMMMMIIIIIIIPLKMMHHLVQGSMLYTMVSNMVILPIIVIL